MQNQKLWKMEVNLYVFVLNVDQLDFHFIVMIMLVNILAKRQNASRNNLNILRLLQYATLLHVCLDLFYQIRFAYLKSKFLYHAIKSIAYQNIFALYRFQTAHYMYTAVLERKQ